MCWAPFRPYHPLPVYYTGSLLSYWVPCRYLAFLAVDWLRTVSATPLLRVVVWFVCLSSRFLAPLSSVVSPYLAFCLCWAFVPPLSLPSRFLFFLVLSLIVYLLPGLLACLALLAVLVYLGSTLAFVILGCLFPWVWCLVFLAVDWSRISSIVPSLSL